MKSALRSSRLGLRKLAFSRTKGVGLWRDAPQHLLELSTVSNAPKERVFCSE